MNILLASDKFKGSLTASEVANAIASGIKEAFPNIQTTFQPMADGGDGSIDLLNELWGLEAHTTEVHDPLNRKIQAGYFTSGDTAFIEFAKASGIALLKKEEQNCMHTTSLGTGELMVDALKKGFHKIKLFLGGSSTNDGAIGIATAFGYRFLDEKGTLLEPVGGNLRHIATINKEALIPEINDLELQIVCDVNNPFYGPNGAAHIYARQKGASDTEILLLDQGLRKLDVAFQKAGLLSVALTPGAGAAGGTGGGLLAMFQGTMVPGTQLFIDLFNVEEKVRQADIVISGEGGLDKQSLQGKVVSGMLQLCARHKKPLVIFCGQNTLENADWKDTSVKAVYAIMDLAPDFETAIEQGGQYLKELAEAAPWHTFIKSH